MLRTCLFAVALIFAGNGSASVARAEESSHSSHEHHAHMAPEVAVSPTPAMAEGDHAHHHHDESGAAAQNSPAMPLTIGLDEKLGQILPRELPFRRQDGEAVSLGAMLGKPTVIVPIFYGCSSSCPMIMQSVATIATMIDEKPGVDFNIVSVSFDPSDTPEDAAASRKNFLKVAGDKFPPEAWNFLVGEPASITSFLSATGIRVQRLAAHNFAHPNAIMVVSPEGKIARYLYGTTFLPFDLSLALREASRGTSGITARRALSYCFTFDSAANRYVVDVTKLSAAATLTVASGFGLFLAFGGKKKPQRKKKG